MSDWKAVIGLEVHAELMTESKMFSACPVVDSVEAEPNTAVDVLSLGMPGTLPVVNQRAIEFGLRVGLALNCEIPAFSQFARKSYFYPDLPKGFQISQYDHPLAINGYLDIEVTPEKGDPYTKRIRIRRAHLEEDTGKLVHADGSSYVDYNRAGVPLLEIVTEPDINSAAEAETFARTLRAILQYLGVNNGDMSKGVLRVEPNISVMHKDDTGFRTRTEVKNLNSLRYLYRASAYEIDRQIKAWTSGEVIKQATMGWDDVKQRTVVQRYKERADEYRYFPEPDLPIVEISPEWMSEVKRNLPELPIAKQARFQTLGLSAYDAGVLTQDKTVADYYEAVLAAGANAKSAANWFTGGLFTLMNKVGVEREAIVSSKITPAQFAALVKLVDGGTLNKGGATEVLAEMWESGRDPAVIVAEKGLAQVSDTGAIQATVSKVLDEQAGVLARYFAGEDKLFGALVGACMKAMAGKGDPKAINEALRAEITKRKG